MVKRIVKDTPQIKHHHIDLIDYNAEYGARNRGQPLLARRKRHASQKIGGQETLMQAWEKAPAPSDSAVLLPQTPWSCARCNLEPIDTIWRPLDGATAFDTEERICGACWLVADGRGAGSGDHGRDMVEDERELRRLKRNEYPRQWRHNQRVAINRAPSASAVLPPRPILQGVALASPDSTESIVV